MFLEVSYSRKNSEYFPRRRFLRRDHLHLHDERLVEPTGHPSCRAVPHRPGFKGHVDTILHLRHIQSHWKQRGNEREREIETETIAERGIHLEGKVDALFHLCHSTKTLEQRGNEREGEMETETIAERYIHASSAQNEVQNKTEKGTEKKQENNTISSREWD